MSDPKIKTNNFSNLFNNLIRLLSTPPESAVFKWDIPHGVEKLLDVYSSNNRQESCYLDETATCYNPYKSEKNVQLTQVAACPGPLPINSGSHKTIFDLNYRGERFVIAVEERESFGCAFEGENIFIGAETLNGRTLARSKSFATNLVEHAIYLATGTRPLIEETRTLLSYDTRPGMDKPIEVSRYDIEVTSADTVLDQGCELSSNSKGCAAFIFEGLIEYGHYMATQELESTQYIFHRNHGWK